MQGGKAMMRLWQTRKISGMLCVLTAVVCVVIAGGGLGRWATAQAPVASGAGNTLIGTPEGSGVVVDPALFPKTFKEAP